MTTLQERPALEMEQTVRDGFSLNWLQQLKEQIPGAAAELANDPTLADNTPGLLDESPNQTQRTRGRAAPRGCAAIRPPTPSGTRTKSGATT